MVRAHAAQIQEVEPTADGCEDCLTDARIA
jgi:hypothetical protein